MLTLQTHSEKVGTSPKRRKTILKRTIAKMVDIVATPPKKNKNITHGKNSRK